MTPLSTAWSHGSSHGRSHDGSHGSFFSILFFFFTNTGHLSTQPHHMYANTDHMYANTGHMYAQPQSHVCTATSPDCTAPTVTTSKNASVVLPLELKSLIFVYIRGSPPVVFPFIIRSCTHIFTRNTSTSSPTSILVTPHLSLPIQYLRLYQHQHQQLIVINHQQQS